MKRTSSAGGVVLNPEGKVLVVSQHGNSWSMPKGHIEPGETPEQAARREIAEESGITQLELVKELGSYERFRIALGGGEDRTELKTIQLFLFRTNQEILKPTDPENPEALWLEKHRAAGLLTHPRDRQFFESIMHVL